MSTLQSSVVRINLFDVDTFRKRLESLNKKAEAFGLAPVKVLSTVDVVYRREIQALGRSGDTQIATLVPAAGSTSIESPVVLRHIELEYPIIRLGSWDVVGKLSDIEGGRLTFAVTRKDQDHQELMERSKCPAGCEHCNVKRTRKESFILRNEQGQYMEVGTSCLKDFTGVDPGAVLFLARLYEFIRINEDDAFGEYGAPRRSNVVMTDDFLASVIFFTEECGFVSTAKANDTGRAPTYVMASNAQEYLRDSQELKERFVASAERRLELARKIREWVLNKPAAESVSDMTFENNLKLLLAKDHIELNARHLAFAAAGVPAYRRNLTEQKLRAQSSHQGEVGKPMQTELTVRRITPIETQFGITNIVSMIDQAGNQFVWKTSACPDQLREMPADGSPLKIEAKFKVKSHDEYRGAAQTAVTHLKVLRVICEREGLTDSSLDHEEEMRPRARMTA